MLTFVNICKHVPCHLAFFILSQYYQVGVEKRLNLCIYTYISLSRISTIKFEDNRDCRYLNFFFYSFEDGQLLVTIFILFIILQILISSAPDLKRSSIGIVC